MVSFNVYATDGKAAASRQKPKSRKSMSLPASPLVSLPCENPDTSTSTVRTTPLAELKLIEEVRLTLREEV